MLSCEYGEMVVAQLRLRGITDNVAVSVDSMDVAAQTSWEDDVLTIMFEAPITLSQHAKVELMGEG